MSHFVLGPSPYDAEHTSLHQRLTQLHDEIGRLTAEAATVEQQIEHTLQQKQQWETNERERLQKQENERIEKERLENERIERERLEKEKREQEKIERERWEREEQERIARERVETEKRLEAEKIAKQVEKERLEREWMEREKQEQLVRETNERKRKETEAAALVAATAGAIAVHSHTQSHTGTGTSDSTAADDSMSGGGVSGLGAPKEMHVRARALYDLDGDEANDELSFVTGDIFTVSGEMNGWMSAQHERTGKVGLVPSNYITVIEQLIESNNTTHTLTADKEMKEEMKEQDTTTSHTTTTASGTLKGKGKGECVIALFDFIGENDDEISFNAGQRLWKTGEVNGWYIGTLDGTERVGIFPSNFVEPATEMKEKPSINDNHESISVVGGVANNNKSTYTALSTKSLDENNNNQSRAMPLSAAPSVQRTKSTAFAAAEVATLAQMAADSQAPDTPRTSISGRRPSLPASASAAGVVAGGVEPDAVALYRFQATSSDQLSFDKGAKLLIKATLNGWYVGQEIGREALGIFPANYVQKIDKSEAVAATANMARMDDGNNGRMDDDMSASEQSYRYKQRTATTADTTQSIAAASQQSAAVSEASVVIGRVTALYDFHSTTAADSLSFNKGDEIAVVKEIKGWWAGSVVGRDGKLGLVPSNYCTPLRPEPAVASGASVVGGQYPVMGVGVGGGGVVKDMKVEQVIMPGQGQGQPATQSSMAAAPAATAASTGTYGGASPASVTSPSSTVGRSSGGGSAPPLLSAKPALLSSLAAQANGGNMAIGSRPSLQPVQPTQPVQSTPSIVQPIAVIEPTATPASPNTANTATTTTTTTTPATASTPAITTTHTPAVVVAAPATSNIPTTTAASSATPSVAAAAAASQAPFTRQPTDRLAIAEHDWDTTERGELAFKKDDRIIITREKSGWYTGYIEGQSRKGMFPSTFVRLVPEDGAAGAAVAASIAPTVTNTPVTSRPPSPTHQRTVSTSLNYQPGAPVTPASADPATHPILVQLERGMQVTKLDSHGYPKMVRMYIEREKLSRGKRGDWIVRWDTKKFNKRDAQLTLAKCRVKRGLKVQEAGGSGVQNAFTVLSPLRNLQVICANETDREQWMEAFGVLGVPYVTEDGATAGVSGVGAAAGAGVNNREQSIKREQSVKREQSMKRASTPAPTVVADTGRDEVVSMHDILAQGPPSPPHPAAASHVKVEDEHNPATVAPATVSAAQPPQRLQQSVGGARVVQALYDFGSEIEDLPMVAGDRIELLDAKPEEQWWRGRNLSKPASRVGMFPRSYVSEVVETFAVLRPTASGNGLSQMSGANSNSRPSSRASNAPPPTATTAAAPANVTAFTPIATIVPPSSTVTTTTGAPLHHAKVRALYDFETDLVKHPNDLPFRQGEVLTLLSKDNEWWTGVDSRGRKGMFPAAFVKEIM